MTNFDTAREALETSLNSSGSAMKEHEKWQKSLEAQINKLKASWQGLSQAFLKSDFLKNALDFIIDLIDGITKLIDKIGTLPTLIGAFAGYKAFSGIVKNLPTIIRAFSLLGRLNAKGLLNIANAMRVLKVLFPQTTKVISKFVAALKLGENASGDFKGAIKGIWSALKAHWIVAVVVAAITILTAVFGRQAQQAEKLSKKVEELTEKYKEQHDELKKLEGDFDTSKDSSMISKYEKLSRGVDNLGRNVSLTAEEYSEYQDITNKIAEQFPSLVSGYDEQGNALLSVKGNVEALTEAYEKLIHTQNQQILTNTGDIEKDFENTLKKESGKHWWSNGHGFWAGLWGNGADVISRTAGLSPVDFVNQLGRRWVDYDLKEDTVEGIQNLLDATSESEKKAIYNKLSMDRFAEEEIRDMLDSAGYEVGFFESPIKALKKAVEDDPKKFQEIVDNYYSNFAAAVEEQKSIAQAVLSEAFDVSSVISGLNYGNIGEDLQAVANQVVSSLDYNFFKDLQNSGKTVEQWTKEMLTGLNSISKADNAEIEAGFDLQTQFNGGEISYGEYVKNLQGLEDVIDSLDVKDEVKEQLKISLSLDENGVIDQYNALVKRLTDSKNYDFDISETEAKKLLDGLSSEELAIAVDVITDLSNNNYHETAEEIKTAIERELAIQGLSLDLNIEVEKTKLEAVATAISESFSGSGLSKESISAVEDMFKNLNGYDSSKLFERTANGIRLNSEEYRKLNSQYKKTNIAKVNKQMDSLGDIYNQTREELYRLTYGTDEYNAKAAELGNIEQQIKDLEQLQAGYRGLTSAFQEWQMAESAGSQRDMYESIIEGFENIDDEIKRGWYDDGTIEFLELLSGKDLSTAGIEEVKKAYKGLSKEIKHTSYSVRDFFTVDDEGNSTNAGVYNFLDAIGQLEEEAFGGKDVVQRKNGKIIGFDFQIVGGDKVIAEALGISEELVQIMVRAADDAGFVVSMDGTYQQLDVLKEKAQEASETLNRILEKNGKKGFDFNFNTSNVDDVTKQLGKAKEILDTFRNTDGTINTKLKGANEALTVASTLQSMLDKLTRPTYMDIQVNQVEDELQEPLKQLQELRRLTETKHQLKLSGGDTTELQKSINELYAELDSLPDETKIEIGLVDDKNQPLTGDALKNKINDIVSGDTELGIKATVDIQLEMDEKLGILVDKALLEAGIIDKKEFKKRVDIYLDVDVDNEDAKNKTEKAVNEVVGNSGSKTTTKSDAKKTKLDTKIKVESTKIDIESEVKKAKSEIANVKSEIANAKSDVAELAKGLQDLKSMSEEISVNVEANLEGNVPDMDEGSQIDDLLMFAEGAKALKGLGLGADDKIAVNVTANLEGNVPDMDESEQIDDLLMFAAGAKALKEVEGDITSNVSVDLYGNLFDNRRRQEKIADNLKVFIDSAKGIKDVPNDIEKTVSVDLYGNLFDNRRRQEKIADNLKVFIDSAQGISSVPNTIEKTVEVNLGGNLFDNRRKQEKLVDNLAVFIDSADGISGVPNVIEKSVKVDFAGNLFDNRRRQEKIIDNLDVFIDSAKGIRNVPDAIEKTVKVDFDGNLFDNRRKQEKLVDNLDVFVDSAKGIKDVPDTIEKTVKVDFDGNLFDNRRKQEKLVDNLKVFVDSAKGIDNIPDTVEKTVKVDFDGNLFNNRRKQEKLIDNLGVFVDSAKGITNIPDDITKSVKVDFDGNLFDNRRKQEKLVDNLKVFIDSAKGINSIKGNISSKITADFDGNLFNNRRKQEKLVDNLKVFIDSAKGIKNIKGEISSKIIANFDGNLFNNRRKQEKLVDNLAVFIDSAKGIKNIQGNISSKIIANFDGNLFDNRRRQEKLVDNLKVFIDSAKGIKNIQGEISSKITANFAGNLFNNRRKQEKLVDNLGVFIDSAKGIKNIQGDISSKVTANIYGNVFDKKKKEKYIDNLQTFAKGAKALQNLKSKTVNIGANIASGKNTKNDATNISEDKLKRLQTFAKGANALQGASSKTVNITANASGNAVAGKDSATRLSSLTSFSSLANKLDTKTVTVTVTANVDSKNVNAAIDLLNKVSNSGVFKDYNATVKVGAKVNKIDDTVVKNYIANEKTANGKVKWANDESLVNQFKKKIHEATGKVKWDDDTSKLKKSFTANGTVNWTSGNNVKVKVTSNASGTANACGTTSGRAFARGNWGIKGNGVALGGELGQELVVRDGKFFTIGDAGAEFFRYKKNDIVFNAAQTESLFKYGGIKGANPRGKMLATGTAFAEGLAFGGSSGSGGAGNAGGNSVTGQSYGSNNSSSDKDFEEIIDWIEVIIDRVERSIDKFDQQANNIYKSWSGRNTALQNQISEVNNEIGLQQKAYNKYMSAANGVGLSSSWKKKVQSGAIDIDTIKDESLKEKIADYQKWYEKALDCKDAIEELKEQEAKLYAQRVENVSAKYEGILGVIEHEKNMLEEYISQSEAQGWLVSGEYYNALIGNEKDNIAQLEKEKADMLAELQTAMQSGTIVKGSEAWYDMIADIDAVTLAIAESQTQLLEYEQTIQQLSWETFDILQEKISAVTEESNFLIDLMSSDKLYDDNGQLTDKGKATMGLHGQNYNTHMYQADQAGAEAARLREELAKDPFDKELEERYREMIALQQEHILAAQDEKEAIRDMVEEGIQIELDALQERIDKYNESIESQKDLYDYQKRVKEQTEEIASLEKQIASYRGDNSEETRAKVQELEVSLKEAKSDLEETEYDKYISDQQQLLDELYLEYETTLNTRLDNIDALLSDMIVEINSNATVISDTLRETADSVGYTLSDSMQTIWDNNSNNTTNVITTYGEKFSAAQTTTNNALNVINTNLQNMITQLNKLAKTNVKSASTSSAANSKQADDKKPTTTTNDKKPTTNNTNKFIKVGGKINAKGAQIYDYAGDTSGERQLYRNDPVYKVLKATGNWLQVRWHKLSNGVTGWFKKGDVKALATGARKILSDDVAWTQEKGQEFIVRPSDGAILTPVAKGDSVLNATASGNIWSMANNPTEFIRDNLKLDAANVPNGANVQSNYTQHFDKVIFNMPNVKNYGELVSEMQRDPKFEKLIHAMTVDQIAGKSKLAKNKAIR